MENNYRIEIKKKSHRIAASGLTRYEKQPTVYDMIEAIWFACLAMENCKAFCKAPLHNC